MGRPRKNQPPKPPKVEGMKLSDIDTIEKLEEYAELADEPQDLGDKFEFNMIKHIDPLDNTEVTTENGGLLPRFKKEPVKVKHIFRPWNVIATSTNGRAKVAKFFMKHLHRRGIITLNADQMIMLDENVPTDDKFKQMAKIIKDVFISGNFNSLKKSYYLDLPENYRTLINYEDEKVTFKNDSIGANTTKELTIIFYVVVKMYNVLEKKIQKHSDFPLTDINIFGMSPVDQLLRLLQYIPYIMMYNEKLSMITKEEWEGLSQEEKELIHATK